MCHILYTYGQNNVRPVVTLLPYYMYVFPDQSFAWPKHEGNIYAKMQYIFDGIDMMLLTKLQSEIQEFNI